MLDNGAKVDVTNNLGYTPLDIAVEYGYEEIIKLLQDRQEMREIIRKIYLKIVFGCKLNRIYSKFLPEYYSPNGKGMKRSKEEFESLKLQSC